MSAQTLSHGFFFNLLSPNVATANVRTFGSFTQSFKFKFLLEMKTQLESAVTALLVLLQ